MTKTKIVLASLFALGFATSAFASDSGLDETGQVPLAIQQQEVSGANAYAYAPMQIKVGFTNAERREFNRVPVSEVSGH